MANIFNQIAGDSNLVKLLGDYKKSFVGFVYGMRFNEVLVLTNDDWKHIVDGLPHNSFLVAAGFDPTQLASASAIDQEVVLLRVLEPVSLPQDSDLIRTRIEHHQRRTPEEMLPGGANDGMDPLTHSEMQAGGLRCRILGTFYINNGELRLGSDIENFMSMSRLRAYKPVGKALDMIVNHVNADVLKKAEEEARKAGFSGTPSPIEIGTVRYTSTDRMHRGKDAELVTVKIQPTDFLARRTAVLGMTRTGKSNTVKTMVSAVAVAAMKDGVKVGQLIFDVNGEYANANHQDDGSSIADVFPISAVRRYRAVEKAGFEDLRANFYQDCGQALNLIQNLFKNETSPFTGQDVDTFMSSTLEEPSPADVSEYTRWKRHKAVFQCILSRAGYPEPPGLTVEVPRVPKLLKQINDWAAAQTPPVVVVAPASDDVSTTEAAAWYEFLRRVNLSLRKEQEAANAQYVIGLESTTKHSPWVDPVLASYMNMMAQKNTLGQSFGGWRAITKYKKYHSAKRTTGIVAEILGHLDDGRIVIMDLSAGPVEIREVLSKRIASQIFERQMETMHAGGVPQNMVLYVEEAHNLIGKKADLTDTWPRIAKEGAKARIAFVYATQEPSSVHPNILANTENWFVTHLNNDDELKTLGKFYDFGDFTSSLKAAQDVGFARIKTLSSPFVIPTQIKRFTPEEIKATIAAIEVTPPTAKK